MSISQELKEKGHENKGKTVSTIKRNFLHYVAYSIKQTNKQTTKKGTSPEKIKQYRI